MILQGMTLVRRSLLLPAALLLIGGCGQPRDEVQVPPAPAPPVARSSGTLPEPHADSNMAVSEPSPATGVGWGESPPPGWEPSRIEELIQQRAAAGLKFAGAIDPGLMLASEYLRLGQFEHALAAVQDAIRLQDQAWAQDTAAGLVRADAAVPSDWLPEPLTLMAQAAMWMALELESVGPGNLQASRYPLPPGTTHEDPLRTLTVASTAKRLLDIHPDLAQAHWYLRLATAFHAPSAPPQQPAFTLTPRPLHTVLRPAGPAGDLAVLDADGDGLLDILLSDLLPHGGLRLLTGRGDGSFQDGTGQAGLTTLPGGTGLESADIDGDGDTDLLVLSDIAAAGGSYPVLLRNENGVFHRVSGESGLDAVWTRAAAWLDYDSDGDQDLFLGGRHGRLLRQDEPWKFQDATAASGLTTAPARRVVAADVDRDGHMDLYLQGDKSDHLYLSKGDGTFHSAVPVLNALAAAGPVCFLDGDHDGDLDLFAAPDPAAAMPPAAAGGSLSQTKPNPGHAVLMIQENGQWHRHQHAPALEQAPAAGALVCADLDGDGDTDIYLAADDNGRDLFVPHRLLLQDQSRFVDATATSGGGLVLPAQAADLADTDGDGHPEIILLTGSRRWVRPRLLIRLYSRSGDQRPALQ